jgi:hypothetical protein
MENQRLHSRLFEDLHAILPREHRYSVHFWAAFDKLKLQRNLDTPESWWTAIEQELSTLDGFQQFPNVAGPMIELLEERVRILSNVNKNVDFALRLRSVFDEQLTKWMDPELFDKLDGLAVNDMDRGLQLSIVNRRGEPNIGPAEAFQVRVVARRGQTVAPLHVYLLQRDDKGTWSLLYPNLFDHRAAMIVPGIEHRVPEDDFGYTLRAPSTVGDCLIRAFVSEEFIPFPVTYVRGVTKWTRGESQPTTGDDFVTSRKKAFDQLLETARASPGLMTVGECSLTVTEPK